ncbi:putative iron/ascorbate oxidoreductase [Lachnellula arida]|uniref:Putative iron/ascorbate oxidoreductase n=1 Tax=Lachnellula arida TaxID=1316785 RepID=A0A8T9BCE3_9HELO|nr:putative iron/ascorbate oxidoreductase [Lachnellula arida]
MTPPSPSPSPSPPSPTIPIINLSPLTSSPASPSQSPPTSAHLELSRTLVQACHSTGFVYITGHGIPASLIHEAFSYSRAFFALAEEQKALVARRDGSKVFRGWSAVGREQVGGVVDWTESYGLGIDNNPTQPNLWPPSSILPGFRPFMHSFQDSCWAVSQIILRALALGLGLPDHSSLLKFHAQSENELSLRHYPAVDADVVESGQVDRLGAHTDYDSFTLLWQDGRGGLEVWDRNGGDGNGGWVDVRAVEGALVMNIGDVLQRWSNDFLVSTLHRVHLPPLDESYERRDGKRMTVPRFSIPYFVIPKGDTVMEPLEGGFGEGQQKKYEPVSFGEYQAKKNDDIFR